MLRMDTVRIEANGDRGIFADQLVFTLRSQTSPKWAALAADNMGEFLQDHASAERKANANCLMLVAKYQDRVVLVESLLELAKEELQHFSEVVGLLHARGLLLQGGLKDPYIQGLHDHMAAESEARLLDRLLICSMIEARGCERFGLLSVELERRQDPLAEYYKELSRVEARHFGAYLRIAKTYFASEWVEGRLAELLEFEGSLQLSLPVRPALH